MPVNARGVEPASAFTARRTKPEVIHIAGGWGALGDGWATYALTKEEAVQRFRALIRLKLKDRSRRPSRGVSSWQRVVNRAQQADAPSRRTVKR